MPYDLLTYFNQRFAESKPKTKGTGKFVTISRQTGCNGTGIAQDLVHALEQKGHVWKFINKEILEQSASKLKLDTSQIKYVFETRRKTHADDVISALSSRYYKSDKVVRNTITEVLQHYAKMGNVIMVGRAGVATTEELEGGLHIRLIAPYSWRYNSLMNRSGFENQDVGKFIEEHDKKKRKLIKDFSGKSIDEIEFDLTINTKNFTRKHVVDLIITAMRMNHII